MEVYNITKWEYETKQTKKIKQDTYHTVHINLKVVSHEILTDEMVMFWRLKFDNCEFINE